MFADAPCRDGDVEDVDTVEEMMILMIMLMIMIGRIWTIGVIISSRKLIKPQHWLDITILANSLIQNQN